MVLPRREPGFIVPAISVRIEVEFQPDTIPVMGRLWDSRQTGACLLFLIRHAVAVGQCGALILSPPNIGEPICARAEMLWVDRLRMASNVGGLFLETVPFEPTFLAMLMSNNGRPATGLSRHELLQDQERLLDLGP
jgi:hypothetical protein